MARLGGAHHMVGAGVERGAHLVELRRVAVGQSLRREAFLRRGLLHLEAVLVRARDEEHVLAVEPLEAGDRVGGDALVGVADMRLRRWRREWRS